MRTSSTSSSSLKPKALAYIISGQCLYMKCKVGTYTCNLPVIINSVYNVKFSLKLRNCLTKNDDVLKTISLNCGRSSSNFFHAMEYLF